jgi:transcriptional regulator with XRE-family HTH domain
MIRLKELREERDMKQLEIAQLLAVKQQAISKYERGNLCLSLDQVIILARFFGVTTDYFLGVSSQRSMQISDEDAALVAAYRAADKDARAIVDLALKPYFAEAKTPEAAG